MCLHFLQKCKAFGNPAQNRGGDQGARAFEQQLDRAAAAGALPGRGFSGAGQVRQGRQQSATLRLEGVGNSQVALLPGDEVGINKTGAVAR